MKNIIKATITGSHGFIGSALKNRLLRMGWEVYSMPRPDIDYMFLFGSPSSNYWFEQALEYSKVETIGNFINAMDFCKEHNIKLIYPSSGTVYERKTPYSKCKYDLELLSKTYKKTLGLRIFAGYGAGEEHKGEYASIVYQFINNIKEGRRPVIWGDGNQTRDFVYIDDIIEAIINNRDKTGIMDIGTGVSTSFNQVVKMINKYLMTKIKPVYIKKPDLYIENTVCKNPIDYRYSISQGILFMINRYERSKETLGKTC
jgi:nucleoside-diphosphate-sugar epimerase